MAPAISTAAAATPPATGMPPSTTGAATNTAAARPTATTATGPTSRMTRAARGGTSSRRPTVRTSNTAGAVRRKPKNPTTLRSATTSTCSAGSTTDLTGSATASSPRSCGHTGAAASDSSPTSSWPTTPTPTRRHGRRRWAASRGARERHTPFPGSSPTISRNTRPTAPTRPSTTGRRSTFPTWCSSEGRPSAATSTRPTARKHIPWRS